MRGFDATPGQSAGEYLTGDGPEISMGTITAIAPSLTGTSLASLDEMLAKLRVQRSPDVVLEVRAASGVIQQSARLIMFGADS